MAEPGRPPLDCSLILSTLLQWAEQSLIQCSSVWKSAKPSTKKNKGEDLKDTGRSTLTQRAKLKSWTGEMGDNRRVSHVPGKAVGNELYQSHPPTCSCVSLQVLSSPPPSPSHPEFLAHTPLFPAWSRTCPHPRPEAERTLQHVQRATHYHHPLASIISWEPMISYSWASCGGSWKLSPCPEEVERDGIVEQFGVR